MLPSLRCFVRRAGRSALVALCVLACPLALQGVGQAEQVVQLWRGGGFSTPMSVSANSSDGSCWIADYGHGQVVHVDHTGATLWRGGTFTSPVSVSANPSDGSCWVADQYAQLSHLASNGTLLWRSSRDLPPSLRHLGKPH